MTWCNQLRLERLAMDPRRSPPWVFFAHPSDEIAQLARKCAHCCQALGGSVAQTLKTLGHQSRCAAGSPGILLSIEAKVGMQRCYHLRALSDGCGDALD